MRYLVQVEVEGNYGSDDIAINLERVLNDYEFSPENLSVRPVAPEPSRLPDFPPKVVRRSTGSETYRVVLPGLLKDGAEVTVPVWEPDVDLELLLHVLDNEGTWE